MSGSDMPPTYDMQIGADELRATMLGQNLLVGRARATVVDDHTGRYISLRAGGWRHGASSERFTPWAEAERVYFNVPNSDPMTPDDPAGFYDLASGRFVQWSRWGEVDATRAWAARYMLNAAADRDLSYAPAKHLLVGTHCMRCGKELDKRESILAGMGETCAAKAGLPYDRSGPGHQLKAAGGRVVWVKPPEDPDELLRDAARRFADGDISIEQFDEVRMRARALRRDHVEQPHEEPRTTATLVAADLEPPVAPAPEPRVVRQAGVVRAYRPPVQPVEPPVDISDLPISLRPGEDLDGFIARWDSRIASSA